MDTSQPAPPATGTNPNYASTANALIQQITEPAAVNVINVNVIKQPLPATNFVNEIQSMLYGFGDSRRPRTETAVLVDEVVRQQMTEVISRAIKTSYQRGANGTVGVEDIAFLLRKNPLKVQSLYRHLSIKDMAGNATIAGAPTSDIYGPISPTDNKNSLQRLALLLSVALMGP